MNNIHQQNSSRKKNCFFNLRNIKKNSIRSKAQDWVCFTNLYPLLTHLLHEH